ncbi:beta strand repeat-containing protein [Flavobacterium sp.]
MKRLLLILMLMGIPFYGVSQVGINTTNPSAQLDIKSSNQATPSNTDGILIPKIDAFPVTNPTAAQQGMMVYLTTLSLGKQPGFYYWDNPTLSWIGIAGSKGWDLLGNSGTNPATNFIGTTDDNDLAFRRNSLAAGKIGQFSTSIGVNSMTVNSAGNNTAFGNQTLPANTTGNSNTAIGTTALFSNTIGNSNLAIGYGALNHNTTSSNNTAIGNNSLFVQSFSNGGAVYATNNTAVGESALFSNNPNSNTTGRDNTALGYNALYSNTSGSNNIAIGANADVPNPTANNQMSIGNVIYGADMSTTALGKVGIGVPVPTVKLDVNEPTNTKNTVLNVTHSNPTAATKVIKTNVNSGVLASGVITANENALVLANSVQGIGVTNAISGTTDDEVYGFRNLISNTGTSVKFGLSNSFTGAGTGSVYGVSNRFSTLTATQQNGMFNSFTGTPTGASIGLNNAIEDNGNGVKIGVLDSIANGGNGDHYGIKNVFKGNGSGRRYGISSVFSGNGNGEIWGAYTDVNGTGNGDVVGHYIGNNRTGTGNHYGIQTYLSGDTTGAKYGVDNYLIAYNAGTDPQQGVSNFIAGSNAGPHTGVSNWLSGEGNGVQYGTYNYIDNTGIGIKYGTYNRILSGLNGLHYGVYSDVTKANSYAGYFLGRVSIGTSTINNYILPPSRGTVNQVMQTDGVGNVTWQNPSVILGNIAWGTTGNSGINSTTHFLGTTNDADLIFKRYSIRSGLISLQNTSFGNNALSPLSTGINNVAFGSDALKVNTDGEKNIAIGNSSLLQNTQGIDNVGIGFLTLESNTNGRSNTGIGNYSLEYGNASNNTAMGYYALNHIGGDNNTATGYYSMGGTTMGAGNTGHGAYSLVNVSGTYNTALGFRAADAITSGNYNISIGANSDVINPAGDYQMSIGNVFYGEAMGNITTARFSIGDVPSVNNKFYTYSQQLTAHGDGQSTIYGYRTRDSRNDGSSYSRTGTNKAVSGYNFWGDSYTFGVTGHCDNDNIRSGGILGSSTGGTYWSSLGYNSSAAVTYGVYATAALATGTGRMAAPSPEHTVGGGFYGGLIGSWSRGSVIGSMSSGSLFASYNSGDEYTSGKQIELVDTGNSKTAAYTVTSTDIVVYKKGKIALQNGTAHVAFDADYARLLGDAPIVTTTPMGQCNGIYIESVDKTGFTIKELSNGTSNVMISWIAVGDRIDANKTASREVLQSDFDKNINEVMFNENELNGKAKAVWSDGNEIQFGELPESLKETTTKKG